MKAVTGMKTKVDTVAVELPKASRRRSPRVEPAPALRVRAFTDPDLTVLGVKNVGFRGFAIESAEPVAPGLRGRFLFSMDDEPLFAANAVAVHCHKSLIGDRWISGWEFPEQPGLDMAMERLMDGALSVLSID
jgi:hypothetical protein